MSGIASDSDVQDTAAAFSLYSAASIQTRNDFFADLRARCPVAHCGQDEPDAGYWIVSRYDDVRSATLDVETFSSRTKMLPSNLIPDRPPLTADGERHASYRRVFQPHFTVQRVAKWEPHVRQVCQEAIDRFKSSGTCDLAEDYAKKITLGFASAFMGISTDDEDRFEHWIDDMFGSNDADARQNAALDFGAYIGTVIEEHRQHPVDDIVSVIVDSEFEGSKLEGEALIQAITLILFAALDTTWSALSAALWHLASNPEDRRRLSADAALLQPAIEELLRFYAPVALTREAASDTELDATKIRRGELLLMNWPSANRDERKFADADKVILDRKINPHLAFGIGPHRCLGSAVARLEMRVGVEEFLRNIPEFELVDPGAVVWTTGHVWGPKNVQVRFPVS